MVNSVTSKEPEISTLYYATLELRSLSKTVYSVTWKVRSPRSGVFIHLETEDPKVCCIKPSGKYEPIHSCGVFSNLAGEKPEIWCIHSSER